MYTTLDAYERRLGSAYAAIYGTDAGRALADLAAAQAEIDGRLARRYVVPLTGGDTALAAEWQLGLASEIAYLGVAAADFPEKIKSRAAEVRKQLDGAASGSLVLAGMTEQQGAAGATLIVADAPNFSSDKMQGY